MSVLSILSHGRAAAEARMTDLCVVTHSTTEPTWNPATEQYDTTPSTIYTGKCRVKLVAARLSAEPDAGETTHVVVTPVVKIPATVLGIGVGDEITITSAAFNPTLAGATFRVTALYRDSQSTEQRLETTEVQPV